MPYLASRSLPMLPMTHMLKAIRFIPFVCLRPAAAALTVAALLTAPAHGVLVTVGDGEVVFDSAGFENDSADATPQSPAVGKYKTKNTAGVAVHADQAPEADGPPSADEGEHYLAISRAAPDANAHSWLTLRFSRDVDPKAESITVRLKQWGTPLGADGDGFMLALGDQTADGSASSAKNILTSFGFNQTVPAFVSFTDEGSVHLDDAAESAWNLGQWNDVTYHWDADAKQATLTLNGQTFELINQLDNPKVVNQLHLRTGSSSSQMYVDAPTREPG